MWTLRNGNGIMKAKVSSKLAKKIIAEVPGRWERNIVFIIDSDFTCTSDDIRFYICGGDRLTK